MTERPPNRSAFREVYDGNVRFVWRVLLRFGVPEDDLPDAVQDVFVVVHRKLPQFEGRSKLTTWLFEVCRRIAADRRRTDRACRELPDGDPIRGDAPTDVDWFVDRRRARALLERILENMTEEQRIVFVLFELDELGGDEIAELLDLPLGTVRSRLRLAREVFHRAAARLRTGNPSLSGSALTAGELWR